MTADQQRGRVQRIELATGWTLRSPALAERGRGAVPATVPGCVHTDLMAAGVIGDPLHGENEALQEWIGRTDWTYTTTLPELPVGLDHHELVLEGVDTVATIRIGGVVVASVRNQQRTYRIPLRADQSGALLEVAFRAPIDAADAESMRLGPRPHVNADPFNAVRKMASSFGWDWGPRTATSGLWRPVAIESWASARLGEVRLVATPVDGRGRVEVVAAVRHDDPLPLRLRATVGGATREVEVEGAEARLVLDVDDVELWWPAGYGAQPLSTIEVSLLGTDGVIEHDGVLDVFTAEIGFRTIEAVSTPDAAGDGFVIRVNGRDVFVKGVNWIPDDPFPSRVDAARYARRLDQARGLGANLVRVWGGGLFESDALYAHADRLGLLVWQDCLLACAAYAEEEPLRSEFEAETREALVRLGTHPSFGLLCGNNENLWKYDQEDWAPQLDGASWGLHYYYEVFPRLARELAPQVAYMPGSPFSPDPTTPADDEHSGTYHEWAVWNEEDWTRYRDRRPRFVSEFGWQGPAIWTTLRDALDDEPLTPSSPGLLAHQKAIDGDRKLAAGLAPHLPAPVTMRDWHWAMSLNQALAMRAALEWYRSLQPHLTGAIVWQLNDCWPAVSWSLVDSAERRKPAWYAVRAAFAERLIAVVPVDGSLVLTAANDTDEEWRERVTVSRSDYEGGTLSHRGIDIRVPPRATVRVPLPAEVAVAAEPERECLVVDSSVRRAWWFFAEPRDSALPEPRWSTRLAETPDGVELEITAHTLLRECTVLADLADPDAEVDEQLVTLLPGETVAFGIRTSAPAAFAGADLVRTTNDLVVPVAVADGADLAAR